jgi:hypothetical protein
MLGMDRAIICEVKASVDFLVAMLKFFLSLLQFVRKYFDTFTFLLSAIKEIVTGYL